jgi:hypothetical protein
MEQATLVRVHTKEVGTRRFNAITVVLADLHLTCDWTNRRQLRLAKRLAESHGALFQVDPVLRERVDAELQRPSAASGAKSTRAEAKGQP